MAQPRLMLGQRVALQNDSRSPLLRTTPTQLNEGREVKLMSAWNLRPYILVSLAQEGILQRNLDKNPATKT